MWRLVMLDLNTDIRQKITVMFVSTSTESAESICLWDIQKLTRMVNSQEEETKEFHMLLCWWLDLSFPLSLLMGWPRLAPSWLGTHWWGPSLKMISENKSQFWTTKFSKTKYCPELLKLMLCFSEQIKFMKLLVQCSTMPKIKRFSIDWMKPMPWPVELRQSLPPTVFVELKF